MKNMNPKAVGWEVNELDMEKIGKIVGTFVERVEESPKLGHYYHKITSWSWD